MSTSAISFWQADRNWYIQQRIWTLSASRPAGPEGSPAVPISQTSRIASIVDQVVSPSVVEPLKGAAINALELSSSSRSGYTSSIATSGSLLKLSA
jgi:hypothetical protein